MTAVFQAEGQPAGPAAPRLATGASLAPWATYGGVLAFTLVVWTGLSMVTSPWFFPSPLETAKAIVTLTATGELPGAIGISYFRILTGWSIGCVLGVPLALVAGRVRFVRMLVEPYVNFFRFVPPIAFLGIAILWFGIGEKSKIAIIVYTSLFTVFMNTMAGAMAIDETPSRAALSLGASRRQVLTKVVLPQTIPAIIVGVRIGMGFSFMSVVAAELIAADEGIGYMIYSARLFVQTANAFAGIIALGLMGLLADSLLRLAALRLFGRHALAF
ncbi:MAG: ABC transporter permease [Rhodobacteraceae bacterium]|nr:ABC transporter permease [Paracoccaceae bacterium]